MRTQRLFLAGLSGVLLAGTALAAGEAPRIVETALIAAPHPYDEAADAGAVVAAARMQARIAGKRLMVVFGANWCPDCRALAGVLGFDDVRTWADEHYVVVEVDVGRFTKNLDIAQGFGLDAKKSGIPTVAVVAPDGAVVNADDAKVLSDARTMTPQGIVDVLARWAQAPVA